ncbi:MAG: hypothetical protein QM503_06650 [Bacteroidota bacterium]
MKKIQNFLKVTALLIVASLVMVTMNYCKKTNPDADDLKNSNNQTELIEKSRIMQEHILAFKTKMEYYRDNPGIKSGGELYTAYSAVIELESLLNFDSCFTSVECNQTAFEVSEVTMPLDEIEKINDPDLMQVYYDKVIDTIQAQMGRVNYSNMKLILVDLEVTGIDSNGDAIVSVGALIGNSQPVALPQGDWWWGENEGICETGMHYPEDAASQLGTRVTTTLLPNPPSGSAWWFRNITSNYIIPTSDPLNDPATNYLDYKIFYAVYDPGATPPLYIGDDEKCLSAYEMSTYQSYYVSYAQAEETSTRKFASCTVEPNDYVIPFVHIQHDYTFFIGERLLHWHE